MTDRELMQMVLDAMINALAGNDFDNPYADMKQAAKALRDRLAQPERVLTNDISQERVDETAKDRHEFECPRCGHYCQQREWVGLTDEEIKALASWWPSYEQMPALMTLARDIENSLKERNT